MTVNKDRKVNSKMEIKNRVYTLLSVIQACKVESDSSCMGNEMPLQENGFNVMCCTFVLERITELLLSGTFSLLFYFLHKCRGPNKS